MFFLIALAFFIGLGIYYVTSLDFVVGRGPFDEDKDNVIRDAEYTILEEDSV